MGGIFILVGSLLPWYLMTLHVTTFGGSAAFRVEAFLWGTHVDGVVSSGMAGVGVYVPSGTSTYLELMVLVPSEVAVFLYFPLALLGLSLIGAGLIFLGILRSETGYGPMARAVGVSLSLMCLVFFVLGTYIGFLQVAIGLPVPVGNPLYGSISSSSPLGSYSFSWGLSYGWVGVLIGDILSIIAARQGASE